MLCSRMGDTWQIGTASIREDQRIATGLRFVHWCHASPSAGTATPKQRPYSKMYQHLEDQLQSTERHLGSHHHPGRGHEPAQLFLHCQQKTNAETAVKVAGATAKHCIVIHGVSTFLSGEERHQNATRSASHERTWHTAEPQILPS